MKEPFCEKASPKTEQDEGELKKRIHNLFVPLVKASDSPVFINISEALKGYVDDAKKDFPQKEHCSKTFGTGDNYDDYNVFDYPNYNTEDLESCQELIEEYEKAVKKWFGDSS